MSIMFQNILQKLKPYKTKNRRQFRFRRRFTRKHRFLVLYGFIFYYKFWNLMGRTFVDIGASGSVKV